MNLFKTAPGTLINVDKILAVYRSNLNGLATLVFVLEGHTQEVVYASGMEAIEDCERFENFCMAYGEAFRT